jgi:hypothetical protein
MKRGVADGKPFYAYVPYTLVHFPSLPNPKFEGKTGYGDFPDCLAEMDAHVGDLLAAVDSLGIRDKTIVIFTSDNGPEATWPWQGSSGPWRGYCFTHMEGSLRAPFIIRWSGHVPAGRVSNQIVHEADTFTRPCRGCGRGRPACPFRWLCGESPERCGASSRRPGWPCWRVSSGLSRSLGQGVGRLKRFKPIALRCEKTAPSFRSIVAFAAGLCLIKFVHTTWQTPVKLLAFMRIQLSCRLYPRLRAAVRRSSPPAAPGSRP